MVCWSPVGTGDAVLLLQVGVTPSLLLLGAELGLALFSDGALGKVVS